MIRGEENLIRKSSTRAFLSCCLGAVLLNGCASMTTDEGAAAGIDKEAQIAGMQIVDCLLPGQLRRLGSSTYFSSRRPIKTTASDCNIRGGEYVAYDRANYKTALKVWLPAAEEGDAEAQVYVGEIFEKGLGAEPNYEAAAIWYKKAADQGNRKGLFNLGTLYEQGLGVPEDRLKAMNLYRLAWGLPENSLIYKDVADKQQQALRDELERTIESKDAQLRALEKQIKSLNDVLESTQNPASDIRAEQESLKQLATSLRGERDKAQRTLTTIPKLRSPSRIESVDNVESNLDSLNRKIRDVDFGKYYALVIGNRDYSNMDDLDTPIDDAKEIAVLLEQKYGFKVQLLLDADRFTIMQAINELHEVLGEKDNLLIYYAGHGSLVNVGTRRTGYWLPVNADAPPNDAFWVPNEFVTNHLGRISAKRVLVVADSCFGGLLSSSPGHLFLGDQPSAKTVEYVKYKLPRRSRLLLSSGGEKPVIDGGGDGHSVFAREFINTLRSNDRLLSAPDLFQKVRESVRQKASENNFVQVPEYKSIKGAGHEVGDFFFVPETML